MSVSRTVADVIRKHVTLEVESIDRRYLNVYQPTLQTEAGVAAFFRLHRGHTYASSVLMEPLTKAFIAGMEAFVQAQGIPLRTFLKGQRKEEVAAHYRARWTTAFSPAPTRNGGNRFATAYPPTPFRPWCASGWRACPILLTPRIGKRVIDKEGRGLRTETTLNDSNDFGIGKGLHNLSALRQIGFQASLIERTPQTHRYRVTDQGLRIAFFCTRAYPHLLPPGLAQIVPEEIAEDPDFGQAFLQLDETIHQGIERKKVPA